MKRVFLFLCLLLFPLALPAAPNVVVIITDDQGYGDLGITGNTVIDTPRIDSLARRSGTMERFYVSPVCAPTRACLMTGRYNYRTRCIDTFIGRAMIDPAEVTLAEMLRGAGWATGIFGKWHLGDNHPMRPIDQGFEEALVHRGGGIGQPSDPPGGEGKYTDAILFHNGTQVHTSGYCTDVYFDAAIAWIEKCRDTGREFFAYIPTNAPHGPFHDVPADLLEKYQSRDLTPVLLGAPKQADRVARVFAMIENIDRNVGRLVDRLGELGILDDTIIMFMVDNGPNTRRYVGPFRGSKSNVLEGGIRSPFYFHWPARVSAGRSSDRIAAHIDIVPTVLEACGVKPPAEVELDGRSFLPLLEGKQVEWPERAIFIQSHRGNVPVRYHNFAAIEQRWKLVNPSGFGRETLPGEPRFELYDIATDPGESRDLAAERPDVVARLRKLYDQWFDDVGSTRPDNYAPPRILIGTPQENPVVLTRQDWRHVEGRPWAPDSNGFWMLKVARKQQYDVTLRFPAVTESAVAILTVGDATMRALLVAGATGHAFRGLTLPEGDADLRVTIASGEDERGPWQVEVSH